MGSCVICERSTSGNLEFCKVHYNQHKKDIKEKKPWVRALKNSEQRERRRREREIEDTSLDVILDREYYRRYNV